MKIRVIVYQTAAVRNQTELKLQCRMATVGDLAACACAGCVQVRVRVGVSVRSKAVVSVVGE